MAKLGRVSNSAASSPMPFANALTTVAAPTEARMDTISNRADGTAGAPERAPDQTQDVLAIIEEQTSQTLELLRRLVGLMVAKEGGRDGPSLEELIATVIAQQRQIGASLRQMQGDLTAIANHLLVNEAPPASPNGHGGAPLGH